MCPLSWVYHPCALRLGEAVSGWRLMQPLFTLFTLVDRPNAILCLMQATELQQA